MERNQVSKLFWKWNNFCRRIWSHQILSMTLKKQQNCPTIWSFLANCVLQMLPNCHSGWIFGWTFVWRNPEMKMRCPSRDIWDLGHQKSKETCSLLFLRSNISTTNFKVVTKVGAQKDFDERINLLQLLWKNSKILQSYGRIGPPREKFGILKN